MIKEPNEIIDAFVAELTLGLDRGEQEFVEEVFEAGMKKERSKVISEIDQKINLFKQYVNETKTILTSQTTTKEVMTERAVDSAKIIIQLEGLKGVLA